MKISRTQILLSVGLILIAIVGGGIFRNLMVEREKVRVESLLAPAIAKSFEGVPDPKPVLSFVIATDKSVLVVLRWDPSVSIDLRNDARENALAAARRELGADPASWGRHISVSFADEIVTQGWK